jgi:hypothetical protein
VKRAYGRNDVKSGTLALALLALTAGACATAQPGLGRSTAIPYVSEGTSESGSESWEDEGAPEGESSADDGAATEDGLRQLLGEAEAVLSGGGAGDAGLRDALSRAMADLQAALERKAAQLEGGDPAAGAAADADVARAADALRAALAAIQDGSALDGGAEDGGLSDDGAYEGGSAVEDAPGFLQKVASVLDTSLQIIERIQALRASVRGFHDGAGPLDYYGAPPVSGGSELQGIADGITEDGPREEIAGVITEGGQPVAGASVTMPGLGHAATTGADGSYTLTGVPPRPTSLQVIRGGRTVAEGSVAVQPGRSAVADFDLARSGSRLRRGASVLPSQATVRGGSGPRGTVRGSVLDATGGPVPLASVRMSGLALARTDPAGRFVFRGVPAGAQTIVVSRPGAPAATERLQVRDGQVTHSHIHLALATSGGGRKEATRKEATAKDTARKGTPGRETKAKETKGKETRKQATPTDHTRRSPDPDGQPHVAQGDRRDPGRVSDRVQKQVSKPPRPKPVPKPTPKPAPQKAKTRKNEPPRRPAAGLRPSR